MSPRVPGRSVPRRDRLVQEHVHDSYKTRAKLPEGTCCPACGAVYADGRWRWANGPADGGTEICPACHRIRDKYPGGAVMLSGEFLARHADEILNIVRNEEARAKAAHPLQRIMKIASQDEGVIVTTTDPHLARGIGQAVRRAYKGDLDLHYAEETNFLRVNWKR